MLNTFAMKTQTPTDNIYKFPGKKSRPNKNDHDNRSGTSNKDDNRRLPLAKPKRANYSKQQQQVINLSEARDDALKYKRSKQVTIIPKNTAQEEYVTQLADYNTRITFAIGPAGTGKTMLAVLQAINSLKNGDVSRIVITRPAVGVENENHGFLPGTLEEKMAPWVRPIMDVFEEYWSPKEIQAMIEERIVEISPLMYMRGRTFKDCYIVADEMQNATPEQMKMLLTRIGGGTRVSVTGDLDQTDHKKMNGLHDVTKRIKAKSSRAISICEFQACHVERDEIVKEVLSLY
jgi:phosphate starvation-inducible PhoH-like protein